MSLKLKPALIIGSGFHRHVLGDTNNANIRPLFDWHYLVEQVAFEMQVAIPDKVLSPIQRWETLITRASIEGYFNSKSITIAGGLHQPCLIEKEARRRLNSILAYSSKKYPISTRSNIPLDECWGAVISLNFDTAWLTEQNTLLASYPNSDIYTKQAVNWTGKEQRRLTFNHLIAGLKDGNYRRLWFPNGSCCHPETIRMGLHDYGSAPFAIKSAYTRLKIWERETGITEKHPALQSNQIYSPLRLASEGKPNLDEFTDSNNTIPLSWVTEFLYRPIVFAGVGLSNEETGLWWLLSQRARNLSRKGIPNNVHILLKDTDRTEFWRSRPFGIKPIFCSNWDAGWEEILTIKYDI